MSTPTAPVSDQLRDALRHELRRLAQLEEDTAAGEEQLLHYWEPTPLSVLVHRQCAATLRAAADELDPPPGRPGRASTPAAAGDPPRPGRGGGIRTRG